MQSMKCQNIFYINKQIDDLGGEVIPEIEFSKIQENGGKIPSATVAEVYKRGILIVRGVLDKDEAQKYLAELKQYMKCNGENPEEIGKTFYEVYWSKPQVFFVSQLWIARN